MIAQRVHGTNVSAANSPCYTLRYYANPGGATPFMAVKQIAHKPDLTGEQAKAAFKAHFEPKYTVEDFKGPFRDFVVIKNPFIGVAIKLQHDMQDRDSKFVYSGVAPSLWARVLVMGGLIGFIFWKGLTNEVEAFIESAPEFK
ncbi:MAG TPA: hypothetical protein VMR52_07525 [Dehalococcoidia bacterium]|nr:hypothetical protein [Dehalococcoidia bacterium]